MLSDKKKIASVVLFLATSFVLRLYLSLNDGYELDLNCFMVWSQTATNVGLSSFYDSVWCDYPPFYIYILYFVGNFYKALFSSAFDLSSPIFIVLLKMPANIADIIIGLLLFTVINKKNDYKTAFIVMASYVLNPAIIFDSAVWGQVDSIFTLLIFLSIILLNDDRPELSCACFAVSVLTKPQSLILGPLIALFILKKYKFKRSFKCASVSLLVFIALSIPFFYKGSIGRLFGLAELIEMYTGAAASYAYTSLNACNLWGVLTGFWVKDSEVFIISYRTWSLILMGIYVTLILYNVHRGNLSPNLAAFCLYLGFFMLPTRIHERYLFPIFPFLALEMVLDQKLRYIYGAFSATFLANLILALKVLNNKTFIPGDYYFMYVISAVNILLFMYVLYHLFKSKKLIINAN